MIPRSNQRVCYGTVSLAIAAVVSLSSARGDTVDLYGIDWYLDPARAAEAVTEGKQADRNKPIFCFRVLGDLRGLM